MADWAFERKAEAKMHALSTIFFIEYRFGFIIPQRYQHS